MVFSLGLTAPALAIYEFLLRMENRDPNDRRRYTCCVSYAEIGGAISRDKRSVPKCVSELTEKRLVEVEPTTFYTRDGLSSTGGCATGCCRSPLRWTTAANASWRGSNGIARSNASETR